MPSLFDVEWTGKTKASLPNTDAKQIEIACCLLQSIICKQTELTSELETIHHNIYETLIVYWMEPIIVMFKTPLDTSVDMEWMQYRTTLPRVFKHCLVRITDSKCLKMHLRKLFGVSIGILNDYDRSSKTAGMHCIDHLFDHVPIQEIAKAGYQEAVFETLKVPLTINELAPQAFELMNKCIKKGETLLSPHYISKYDWLLHFGMREIPSESSLEMRLPQFGLVLDALKHFSIRFLEQILVMLDNLIQDRPDVKDKVLSVMQILFVNCMPRLSVHKVLVESILLKCPLNDLKLYTTTT